MAANSVLARLAVEISANNAEFKRQLGDTSNQLKRFTSGITELAGTLGVAFGVQQVASFAFEVSKLSGEAKGVKTAFDRLAGSAEVLEKLKKATGETVSELDLMKAAVQANNFQIPIQNLGRLFEFATLRAQQTGQSVDYLVESIILGIGRKSPLILDNLGISAVRLREKLHGVGTETASVGDIAKVVGDIAEEELKNMAGFSDNAATNVQQLNASWEDFKVTLGDVANSTGILSTGLKSITSVLKYLTTSKEGIAFMNEVLNQLSFNILGATKAIQQFQNQAKQKRISELNNELKELQNELDLLRGFTGGSTAGLRSEMDIFKRIAEISRELGLIKGTTEDPLPWATNEKAAEVKATATEVKNLTKEIKDMRQASFFEPEALQNQFGKQGTNSISESFFKDLGITNEDISKKLKETISLIPQLKIPQEVSQSWIDLGSLVSSGIADLADSLGQAIVGVGDFGQAIIKSLASFAQQFGSMLIATGIGALAFQKFSPIGMIAGGGALVALGAAVKASINNRPNLGHSSGSSGSVRNGPSSSGLQASTSAQNSAPELVTIIKGQDLWVMLKNYERGNGYTSSLG